MSDPHRALRIGVIGAGWFASRRHLPDIAACPDTQLAALCRRDRAALETIRDRLAPETALYSDWREMLGTCELDAVLIATPHSLHYEPAREALARGLHVLLEKPMTVRYAEAAELVATAEASGRTLAVALNPPYWAHCHRLRDAIAGGRLGDVESVAMFWTGNAEYVFGDAPAPANLPGVVAPTMYRGDAELCGGGYLMDGGPHLISEVLWVTGLRAVRVQCTMDAYPSDRRASLLITLSGGAMVTINSVGNSRFADRRVSNRFACSRGTATVEGFGFDTTITAAGGASEQFTEQELPPVPGPVANFAQAILGRAPVASPAEHGAQVTRVLEAAYQSARTGAAVDLP